MLIFSLIVFGGHPNSINYAEDPDSEVSIFAKRTVKDLKLPPTFISPITQSIQVPST